RELRVAGLIFAAVDDDERAELAGGVGNRGVRLGAGEKNRGKEQREAGDSGGPTVPQAQREDHQRSAGEGQEDAKGERGATIAAKIQKLREKQHKREQGADGGVAKATADAFLSSWDGGRAHTRAI